MRSDKASYLKKTARFGGNATSPPNLFKHHIRRLESVSSLTHYYVNLTSKQSHKDPHRMFEYSWMANGPHPKRACRKFTSLLRVFFWVFVYSIQPR